MATTKRSRAWIGIFIFLAVASVGVAGFMIRYNLSLQLTPEKLAEAREVWREKKPASYDFVYTKQLNEDPRVEKFSVRVRRGTVTEVLLNGMPLGERELGYHSMDRLLADIATSLKHDAEPGQPRVYHRAFFDPQTGVLRSYVRRVMGSRQRVALDVVSFLAVPERGD